MEIKEIDLKSLKIKVKNELENAKDLKELDMIFKQYLGKQGDLSLVLRSLKDLPEAKRKIQGKLANETKLEIEKDIQNKKSSFAKPASPAGGATKNKDWFDVTAPGKKPDLGHLHPLTLARRNVQEIFESMGFSVAEGPEVENEWYNFDALNIPKDHPARDQWDTFYLKNGLLLRTHTSPVQIRYMEKNQPPLRIIAPGTVYRHEATDASHEFQLSQVEGLMVDKKISVPNFKAVVGEFFKKFFKKDVKIRLRPDFFPFTEPSFDVSISCVICGGKGCPTCKGGGWVELAGAGMVHPNVLKNCGLNSKECQGWAFGFGLERLTMMKYKIDDVRLFRSGDLRFLNQF